MSVKFESLAKTITASILGANRRFEKMTNTSWLFEYPVENFFQARIAESIFRHHCNPESRKRRKFVYLEVPAAEVKDCSKVKFKKRLDTPRADDDRKRFDVVYGVLASSGDFVEPKVIMELKRHGEVKAAVKDICKLKRNLLDNRSLDFGVFACFLFGHGKSKKEACCDRESRFADFRRCIAASFDSSESQHFKNTENWVERRGHIIKDVGRMWAAGAVALRVVRDFDKTSL